MVVRFAQKVVEKAIDMLVALIAGNVALARRKGVSVGNGCRLYIREFGAEPFLISIGDRVTITSGCALITHDGSTWLVHDNDGYRYQHYAPISIGDDVFIGVNSIVLPGVKIGSRVVVGAGSVVTKNIPDNCVVAGNPARVISSYQNFVDRVKDKFVSERELMSCKGYRERVFAAIALESAQSRSNLPPETELFEARKL